MIIVAIYDKKAKVYDTPFLMPNAAIAVRAFANQCQQDGPIKQFADDYELHLLGEFENNVVEVKFNEKIGLDTVNVVKEYEIKKHKEILAQGNIFVPTQKEVEVKKK